MTYEQFLDKLSNPAKNALLFAQIDSFEKLAQHSAKELLALHGVGPKSIPTIREALTSLGYEF